MIMSYTNDLLMVQNFKTALKNSTSREAFRGILVMTLLSEMGRARINTFNLYQLLVVNVATYQKFERSNQSQKPNQ